MADKQRYTSGKSHENSQNVDSERSPEQNNGVSRDLPGTSGRIVQTHGNTSNQPEEPLGESPNRPDNQSVAWSSNLNVVNNQGPVQLGAGAAVIHKPTYNNYNNQQHHHHHYHPPPHITSPDQYLQWMEQVKAAALRSSPTPPGLPPCPVSQHLAGEEDNTDIAQTQRKTPVYSSHHGNDASFHVPCHCSECLSYHQRQHRPLAEMSGLDSQSRHSGQTHQQRLPQLLPIPQNTEQKYSTKKDKQHQQKAVKQKLCQGSSRPPQSSPSDVRPNVTRKEQADEKQAQTTRTVRSSDGTRPVNSETVPDSVCIIDSRGRSLEPGDAVEFVRDGRTRYGIYVGGQEVVWSERSGGRLLVYKEQLQLTDPFLKPRVDNGDVRVFPPEERVDRAKSRVGTPFREGDWNGLDFPDWVYTGMGRRQVGDETDGRHQLSGCL